MNVINAMEKLMQQVLYPVWDQEAMDRVTALMYRCALKVPFYYLKNMADMDAAVITYGKITDMMVTGNSSLNESNEPVLLTQV